MDTEKLIHRLAKEYLRGLKLTGSLEKMGFDSTDYRPNLCDPLFDLLGIAEVTDELIDIVDKYEEVVISMDYFEFIENGLEMLVNEMIAEIKNTIKI